MRVPWVDDAAKLSFLTSGRVDDFHSASALVVSPKREEKSLGESAGVFLADYVVNTERELIKSAMVRWLHPPPPPRLEFFSHQKKSHSNADCCSLDIIIAGLGLRRLLLYVTHCLLAQFSTRHGLECVF